MLVGQTTKSSFFNGWSPLSSKNFPSVGLNAHLFRRSRRPASRSRWIGQLFGRAETFSIIFRLHGVIKALSAEPNAE